MTQQADWRPTASLETLRKRAEFLATIRQFMADRQILEVETPILSSSGNTDPNIESLSTLVQRPDKTDTQTYYLHTSPEFAMKRLLAAGSESIYQICKVFRDDEFSKLHNPEFTMLEWYRPGFDYHDLMDEMSNLLSFLGFETPEKVSFQELFQSSTKLDPHQTNFEILGREAKIRGLQSEGLSKADLFDFIISDILDKELKGAKSLFLYDYPACMSALARLSDTEPKVAKRFELIIKGIEIANGYDELIDPKEQRLRIESDINQRFQKNKTEIHADERLLHAMDSGLPNMAGVAVGLDRLFMLSLGKSEISEVMAFSITNS